jgi:HAE1 family hydrophobic/amphiphilic exporter-1
MFISEFSIRRPVTATMMTVLLLVFGIIGLQRLGVDLFPDIEFPMITVSTIWENSRPEEVDNNITDELEDAIGEASDIKHIASMNMEGTSFIVVNFELSRDIDLASQEVQEKVSSKLGELPHGAEKPIIDRIDINAQPTVWFCLYGRYPIEVLTAYAKDVIRPLFQKLHGTGEVPLRGAREHEVRIWLNRDKLTAHDITVAEVISALKKRHIEIPGGKVESPQKEFLVRTMAEFQTPEAFNRMTVVYRKGKAIKLKDLGYAESGREDNRSIARFTNSQGKRYKGVGLGITPRSGENKVAVARLAKAEMIKIREMLPPGMHIELTSDSSKFIEDSINEVEYHLIIGGIMAALSIYFFLQSISTTLIAAIAIPTSIIATFSMMYFFGFTMNNMSMLGLTMAVGLVVDDAIVMVENIYRHRKMGKGALQAALDGSREIGFAVISITLALLGVFLPVTFMGGIVGKFFLEFAATVATAIAFSAFIALTLIPMLSSRFLRISENKIRILHLFDAMMERVSKYYQQLIGASLRNKPIVIVLALLSFFGGIWLLTLTGINFISDDDESKFLVRLEAPLEYSLEKTDSAVAKVESILKTSPEVAKFFSITGFSGEGDMPQSNKALIFVTLVEHSQRDKPQKEIMSELRKKMNKIPDLQVVVSMESILGTSSKDADIQFVIKGPDLKVLDRVSHELISQLKKTPGFIDLDRDLELGKPEIQVSINRELCDDLGVQISDVAYTLGALIGGENAVDFKKEGKSYDVRVRLVENERSKPHDLERLRVRTDKGELVELKNFVTIKNSFGPSVINRLDRQRSVTIFSNLEGKVLGDAMPEMEKIVQELLPAGYSTIYMGRTEAFQETGYYITFAFLLAVLLTYMVLASQFESFVHPLTIMTALPLSFVGAFGLLYLTGNAFDLFGMIGLVLLVGMVTKNSILLIEFTNQKRAQGQEITQALIEAGSIRLRPILMTAISTIAGILPVALGLGIGSERRQPMALVVAGGMLSSTVLTLIVIPVIYVYLDKFANLSVFNFIKRKTLADFSE